MLHRLSGNNYFARSRAIFARRGFDSYIIYEYAGLETERTHVNSKLV